MTTPPSLPCWLRTSSGKSVASDEEKMSSGEDESLAGGRMRSVSRDRAARGGMVSGRPLVIGQIFRPRQTRCG